jgi:hypothetical protein
MPLSVKWFNFNARNFDHNFLNELTKQEWRDMADSLLIVISDEDIENAFKAWPDTIYKLSAQEIIKTLKSRRNNLPIIADRYYQFLSKKVIITGTNKQDLFEVNRSGKNVTDVSVYQIKNSAKGALTYHRTFLSTETKELQLYGLDGNDQVIINGKTNSGSLVRIIGGKGIDSVVDNSKVGGFGKRTKVYDSEEGNYISLGNEAKDKTSADTAFNSYTIKNIDYNFRGVYPLFGYNVDDGVFLGASTSRITYGFKKGPCLKGDPCYNTAPYASKQSLGFDVALNTGAFNFFYKGDFTDVIGKLDFNVSARVQAPNFKYNFFGYGNETVINDSISIEDYKLRIDQVQLFPALEVGDENKMRFLFGPIYQQATVKSDTSGDFFSIFNDLTPDDLSRKHYLGVNTQFTYDPFTADSAPKFEARFLINTGYLKQIEDTTVSTAFVRGYVSLFYNIYSKKGKTPILTLATRFGGGYNNGDFEFYQSNIIGGRTNEGLRGYRGERFVGRTSLYNNFEMRLRLFHFNAYVFPAEFGIIGLIDNGRVWSDGETSSKIHTGYGGGFWISPFSLTSLIATYSISEEEPGGLLNIKLGWWF